MEILDVRCEVYLYLAWAVLIGALMGAISGPRSDSLHFHPLLTSHGGQVVFRLM